MFYVFGKNVREVKMKKSLLKILSAFLLSLTVAVCSVACGSKPGDSEGDSAGKTRITLWCQITQESFFRSIEKSFENEFNTIDLVIVSQPQTNLDSSLDARLITTGAPDIVACNGGLVAGNLVASGRLVNIDDIIKPLEGNLTAGARTNKIDGNGEYYTAPLHGFASPVVFYNKDMFEEMQSSGKLTAVQREAVKEPSTYDEFVALADACRAYTSATKSTAHALSAGFSTWHLPHFMQAIHSRTMTVEEYSKLLDRNADPNPFDTDGYENGFRLLRQYYDDGILDSSVTSYSVDDVDSLFYYGSTAMVMGVSLDYETLADNSTFEIGAFYLPKDSDNQDAPRANSVYCDVIAINSRTTALEACKSFISYVMRADVQANLADYGLFPARSDADITGKMSSTLVKLFDEISAGSNDFYQSWSYPNTDITVLNAGKSVLQASAGNVDAECANARTTLANFFNENKSHRN